MSNEKNVILRKVMEGLMEQYRKNVPDVNAITEKMIEKGIIRSAAEIENDHIAFRTLGVEFLGISSLEKIFLSLGYKKMDKYYFEKKKLDAYWYSPPDETYPRIFISELRIKDLSEKAQKIIKSYTDEVKADPVDFIDLDESDAIVEFLHSPLWRTPTYEDYKALSEESEYAAWVIYNRYYLNHYTISVHNLPDGYSTIEEFNKFLEDSGFELNDSGGKVKVSDDKLLKQSSTVAEMIEAKFADGDTHKISGSYVEFAERKVLEEYIDIDKSKIKREMRREGFEAANADKIFESTYNTQTKRRL